jgi:chondroitin 4-sulfotransferase 11
LKSAARANLEFYPNMPFAEFAETVCRIPDEVADGHFRPQHLTVCGPDGEPIADFVGRFENLREGFARVAQEIGEPELELPERNRKIDSKRSSRHYRDFYDERLKSLVYKRYEQDVETFGYSF